VTTAARETAVAVEQKAVDRAYDCYEARLANMSANPPATASASGKDSVAIRRQAEATAEEYGGLGWRGPGGEQGRPHSPVRSGEPQPLRNHRKDTKRS
jgi:hypothetical protein